MAVAGLVMETLHLRIVIVTRDVALTAFMKAMG